MQRACTEAEPSQLKTRTSVGVTHESTEPKPMQISPRRRSLCPTLILQSNSKSSRVRGEKVENAVPRGQRRSRRIAARNMTRTHGKHEAALGARATALIPRYLNLVRMNTLFATYGRSRQSCTRVHTEMA